MIPVAVAVAGIHLTERHDRALGVDRDRSRRYPAASQCDDLLRRVQAANDEGGALVEGAEIYDLIHLSAGDARRDEA